LGWDVPATLLADVAPSFLGAALKGAVNESVKTAIVMDQKILLNFFPPNGFSNVKIKPQELAPDKRILTSKPSRFATHGQIAGGPIVDAWLYRLLPAGPVRSEKPLPDIHRANA
jgi:hypothetical protein